MNRVRLLLLLVPVLLVSVLAASGCGNKGRLVLPPPSDVQVETQDATPPSPPATDPTDSEPPAEIALPPAGEPATDVPPPTGTPEPEDGDG